jgi:phosphatidylethanolamine/phosphatidyl-N-methylethanolamine N-methyltransferase
VPEGLGIQFLIEGLRHRGAVGAVWPSGRPLVEAMARAATRRRGAAPLRLLEVGAGVGPVSTVLASRLAPEDTLDIVELNPAFCATLQRTVGHLPGVRVLEGDVLRHEGPTPYDAVVNGLPLANFPARTVRDLYVHLLRQLRPGGRLVSFQHLLLRQVIERLATRNQRERVRRVLRIERALEPLVTERIPVPRNVPPSVVVVRARPAGDPAELIPGGDA